MDRLIWILAFALTFGVPLFYWYREGRRSRQAKAVLERNRSSGRIEPPSLHPVIGDRCAGMGACTRVCPEGDVIRRIDNRAVLVEPTHCIGHGECAASCPVDAIQLVFGSERRGVDLPEVGGDFQSSRPGVYIAGELGGMGLIRNAFTQGRQAAQAIAASLEGQAAEGGAEDLVIVGAGPAGLSAALEAGKLGLGYRIVDQQGLGGAVLSYPRRKLVMTRPVQVPGQGTWKQQQIRKEELLDLFHEAAGKGGVQVQAPWKLEKIEGEAGDFRLFSADGQVLRARRVLLAIGRRGSPRKLGVPGEDSGKTAYQLLESEIWQDCQVLVVGGGDSALEAALSLSDVPGCTVCLSYRGKEISRAREANRQALEGAMAAGRLRVLLQSQVQEITDSEVILRLQDSESRMANDQVFVFAGGEVPATFLQQNGIAMRRYTGQARS